tara:strand:+ start:41 stop:634 length:594 start_codon:yes stop_codon:yes gene_type:complete
MSSKPKQSEYQATEAEKVQAKVAKAEKDYFNENYSPLLREMRDISLKENYGDYVASRANADVAQTLDKPSLAAAKSVDSSADRLSASIEMQQKAQAQALSGQRQRQIGVLATARGQQADATTGLAGAARISASNSLQSAQRKQTIRDANMKAGLKMGGVMLAQGLENMGTGDGFFDSGESRTEGAVKRFGEGLKLFG